MERLALLSYAAQDAGVPMPRLRALVQAGQEAAVLAYEHHDGTTLADYAPEPTDAQLGRVWDDVLRLHAHRVTHRALTADHMLLTDDGGVLLLPTPTGDVAASDLQIRLDRAQLMAEFALLVGPDRSADLALAKIPTDEIITHRAAAAGGRALPLDPARTAPPPERAARAAQAAADPRPRRRGRAGAPRAHPAAHPRDADRAAWWPPTCSRASWPGTASRPCCGRADWRWGIAALGLSALTYAGAALSLTGFVTEKLSFGLTVLAQLASSFVTLVTPAAVGGAAVNIRYLQRRKIPAAVAAASVGVSQVVAFVMHISLLVIFIALSGTNESNPIKLPVVAYFIIAGLVAIAATVAALPAGRRLLRARVAPTINQVLPQLLQIAQHPRKLAEGIGGTLLLSAAYIGCLAVCVRALGGSIPIASVAVVYLTGSAVGSLVPTPGGLGAIEAFLSAGLTAAGMHGAAAVSAVLLYRLLTFWLPVPIGWLAL